MKALVIVDIQNDFLPGGALEVKEGDEIITVVNKLQSKFDLVVATQDWHPANHESFASNCPNGAVGDLVDLHGLPQVLWPDHCVQDTWGAEFAEALDISLVQQVFRKGADATVDSYSGFFDNGKKKDTGMSFYLRSREVEQLYIVGLATDYCIKFTALDAVNLDFNTTVIVDAIKAVNLHPGDQDNAIKTMRRAGIQIKPSDELII
jgi:nicotinamidase/pyrazinamidase